MKKLDKLGCFVSLEAPNYLESVALNSQKLDANYVMLYLGSPKRYTPITLQKLNLKNYKAKNLEKILPLKNIVVHAPWIANPASKVETTKTNSQNCLIAIVELMEQIGLPLVVVHPGSAVKQSRQEGMENLKETIQLMLAKSKTVNIAIENMVKKGTLLCNTFEELATLIREIDSPRLGVCLDTCHLWDAGYDVTKIDEIIQQLKSVGLIEKIKIIHLNDSKNHFGSNRDIHANLDEGKIGLDALKRWANNPLFSQIPIILETPEGKYKAELAALRNKK